MGEFEEDSPFWLSTQEHSPALSVVRSDRFGKIAPLCTSFASLESLFCVKNERLRRKVPDGAVAAIAMEIDPTHTIRAGVKELRRSIYEDTLKGGTSAHKSLVKLALKTHEEMAEGREPSIGEVMGGVKKKIAYNDHVYVTSGNSKLEKMIREYFPDASIMGKATRDWCTNIQIDDYLMTFSDRMLYRPAALLDDMRAFLKFVDCKRTQRLPICQIFNTSRHPPGQHWFTVIYDPKEHTMQWVDAQSDLVDEEYYDIVTAFCKERNISLIFPYLLSQATDTECGVYSCRKIETYLAGDKRYMLYIPVPDFELKDTRQRLNAIL